MTMVNDILQRLPGVGQPQRRFLAMLFSTILALRGRVNFRHLSRYCAYSERTIARQFRRAFDWPTFHQHVLQTALTPEAEVIAAQDASCIPQSGQQTFGLGHCFNGCTSRPERGLEIATRAIVDGTRRGACTLAVAQTPPGEGRAPDAPEDTRLDFSLQPLRAHRQRLPPQGIYHCVDGAFAQQKDLAEVVRLKLHPMTKFRCEANCRFLYTGPHPQRRGARRKDDGKVNWQELHRFVSLGPLAEADHVQLYTPVVWHITLKQPLRVGGAREPERSGQTALHGPGFNRSRTRGTQTGHVVWGAVPDRVCVPRQQTVHGAA